MAVESFDGIPSSLSYDTFYCKQTNQSYLCYINGRYFYVHDLTPSFHLIQSKSISEFFADGPTNVEEDFIVLSAHQSNSNIVIAIGKSIFVLQPILTSFQRIHWEILHHFVHANPIHCITWLHHQLLFTSQLSIHVTSSHGSHVYKTEVARSICSMISSPKGKAFATFGEHDRLLRIWLPEIESKYTFVYLAHPRAVINVVWEKGTEDWRVLTSAKDGLARLWIWSELTQVFQLSLTIEPPDSHMGLSYHFLNKDALIEPLSNSMVVRQEKETLAHPISNFKKINPEVRSLLDQFDELVFTLQENQTLCIWGISNFGRRLGETTSSLIKMIPNYVPKRNLDTFLKLNLIHQTHVYDFDHVLWIGYSRTSRFLSCFSVYISELVYRPTFSAISLMYDVGGHVIKGPKSIYLLDSSTFISQSGPECIVWRFPMEGSHEAFNLFNLRRISFLSKTFQSNDSTISFPFTPPITIEKETANSKFINFHSASIRLENFLNSTYQLSLIGSKALATYLLPGLTLHYTHSFANTICATFAIYATTYDAMVLEENWTLSLIGIDGTILRSENIARFFSVSSPSTTLTFGHVLQWSLSGDTLACRTSTKVYVFSMTLFTHELYLQATLELSTSFISLISPKPGLFLLAASVENCLTVFSNSLNCSTNTSTVTLNAIYETTFASSIELFQWNYNLELILFANDLLHYITLFPTFISLALRNASCEFYHPLVLREWLMWNEVSKVESLFNHYYYCIKAGLASIPLIPFSYLFPDPSSETSTVAKEDALGVLFDNTYSGETSDFLFSNEDDLHSFTKSKMNEVKDHFLSHSSDPLALPLLSILELLSELKAMSLDDHGKRYFAELLYHYYLGDKQPTLLPSMSFDSFMFAFFSTSQSSLADFLHRSFTLTWCSAKTLGIGWWMTQLDSLVTTIDIIAKNQWRQSSNPLDCIYFYLILPGKRKLLLNLWKQAHGHPEQHIMTQFLSQPVTDKWKKTALKNAFVLLGKQRFELAACFFLLAESYTDAVTVCLRNLNDPQLAFITCRLCQLPITAVANFIHENPPNSSQGPLFLCDWMLGSRTFLIEWIESPAMYILYRSLQGQLNLSPPRDSDSEPQSPSTFFHSHQRQSICKLLSYYRDRNWGHIHIYLLQKLCLGDNVVADGTDSCSLNGSFKDSASSSGEQVEDAFAALFGTTDVSEKKREPDFKSTLTNTSILLKAPLLTLDEQNVLTHLTSQFFMWEALQTNLDVFHCSECKHIAYFKNYPFLIFGENFNSPLAARFCRWTLSPNHYLLFREFGCGIFYVAYAHIVATLMSKSSFEVKESMFEWPPELRMVIESLRSLSNPELCTDFSHSSTEFLILLVSVIYLFVFFRKSVNYGAMAILMKHFPSFFVPPLTSCLNAFYHELLPQLTKSSTSASSHLVLEYLCLKMILNRVEVLNIEALKEAPKLGMFLSNTCFPLLYQLLSQLHYEMQVLETHICSPSEDWLSAAQQELHAALTYNPAWLTSLHASTSLPLNTITPVPNSTTSSSTSSSLDSSEDISSNPTPPSIHSIHTVFKNEYPIFSLGTHTCGRILALALHKHVIELRIDPTSVQQTNKVSTGPTSDTNLSSHGTNNDVLHVPAQEPSQHRVTEFNILKKVHLPRSNSEHLNLNTIMSESGFLLERPVFPVSIATHPYLNLYALAQYVDNKSSLSLYAFEVKEDQMPISHYGSAKIAKILFDSTGSRLGIADGNGELALFDVESWKSYYNLPCHVRYTSDLVFFKSDSLIATAGSAPGHINNVALWDTLMPVNHAKVRGYNIHESGASAVSSDGNYIVSGGKKGDLYVLDVRHTKPLFNIQSSHNCISALVVQDQRVYSGSTDGTLRIYDLSMSTLTEIACYKQLHQSKKLIATSLHQAPVSTLGITEILVRDSYLLTCGADGHVKWLH